MLAYEDPNHDGNSAKWHTGKRCVESGCKANAGTWWSPLWCFEHNVARMKRITAGLNDAVARAEIATLVDKSVSELRDWAYKGHQIARAMVIASGGKLTINEADLDREIIYEGVQYKDGKQFWTVQAK